MGEKNMDFGGKNPAEKQEATQEEAIEFIKRCREDRSDDETLVITDKESGEVRDTYSKLIIKLQEGDTSPVDVMIEAAKNFIGSTMAMYAAMGNNDSEYDIRHYINDLDAGTISPQEVLEKIQGTPLNKQQGSM